MIPHLWPRFSASRELVSERALSGIFWNVHLPPYLGSLLVCAAAVCCWGSFVLFVWLDQVLSPILLLPRAASRVQTVTTRPSLVWVLLGCLRHSVISSSHCTLLVRFPNQSMSSLRLQTYYRLLSAWDLSVQLWLLPWATSVYTFCSFCLCRLEEGHTTQRTPRNISRSSSKHCCFYLSFATISLLPLGRQSDFFLLTFLFLPTVASQQDPVFFSYFLVMTLAVLILSFSGGPKPDNMALIVDKRRKGNTLTYSEQVWLKF